MRIERPRRLARGVGLAVLCGLLQGPAAPVWGQQGAPPRAVPRAVLVAGMPLPPSAPVFTVLHRKLQGRYGLLEDPGLVKVLEGLEPPPTPEQQVGEMLKEAVGRMRRLVLEEVQRTLDDAEPYVQQLPPTPGGRALLGAVCVRRAHVALLKEDAAAAESAIQRGLSADPDLTLDQAQEPPTLVELLGRVRQGLQEAPTAQLRVTTEPPGALVVMAGRPQGRAPLDLAVPRGAMVTIWAAQDGFAPRNVSMQTSGSERNSVLLRLWPQQREQQVWPLLLALRGGPLGARRGAARTLAEYLKVDAVVVAESGAGRTRLRVYGALPLPSPVPDDVEWLLESPPPVRSGPVVPVWVWGLAGGFVGGAILGGVVGAYAIRPH